MTKEPACLVPSETVVRAAQLMKGEDVGPVLVVANKGDRKLVGIVTDRDLALNVVAEGKDPNAVSVKDVMSADLVTCGPDDSVSRVMKLMRNNQVRRIPVVDEDDRLIGIIAQADIARQMSDGEVGDVVQRVSESGASGKSSPHGLLGGIFGGSSGNGHSADRWSSTTRLAIAAAGGGLMFYGLRSRGRTRQIATTAGAALVARGLTGRPFEGVGDLMHPAKAFGF
jgi:CBS domain-containing protein